MHTETEQAALEAGERRCMAVMMLGPSGVPMGPHVPISGLRGTSALNS